MFKADPQVSAVYQSLVAGFQSSQDSEPEIRWRWLEAAHIVGQTEFRLHLDSHNKMLRYAVSRKDWAEAGGQLARLALVPVGHLLGRLPAGNIGRATVNAFRPMPIPPDIRELIAFARR